MYRRDEALLEVENAHSDVAAMQQVIADSAQYVQQLRRRIAELEVWQQQQRAQQQQRHHVLKQGLGADGRQDKDQGMSG